MDFVLALHSHLPWVLNHGRWPHGSDWLCEAAIDTYLPLLEMLRALEREGVNAPVTIGFTPVLANQLADPVFGRELEVYFSQRLATCREAPASLAATGDNELVPLVDFWRAHYERLLGLYRSINGDLLGAFRALEEAGRIEIMGSAATHGYLPLLGVDESIRLQLLVGRHEHERFFGKAPRGCWLPECAYRPEGWWAPLPEARARARDGIEVHLAAAGFRYVFVDSHLPVAGNPLGAYPDVPLGLERFDAERHNGGPASELPAMRTPYRAYRVASRSGGRAPSVTALVRDPRSSMQVWSRQQGYPGDEWYLEFHKIRWPGGLKLWRVSESGADLGGKRPYDPEAARARSTEHARHFAGLLGEISREHGSRRRGAVVAPFDTELFGHWWFEGVNFVGDLYRGLARQRDVGPCAASEHLAGTGRIAKVRLKRGSWGAGGDDRMWLNDQTAWTWRRMWPLEESFWRLAPAALKREAARPVLAQAARSLLLAQASDWQFIISTGAASDYAERRFRLHVEDLAKLLAALEPGADVASVREHAAQIAERDSLFPQVLDQVAEVLQ